ncbi:acyltransferase family protein [Labilibaculum sp.]|uniref:acyltransferase family protein n=1 Tax=Labilibaculum sp. TaxID=2060723 RepID=UPI0035643EA5
MKDRIIFIDRLKGFAIFLVVFGHIIQKHTSDSVLNPLFEAVYSFHMPFFFFLSGYIAEKTTKIDTLKNYATFMNKKAISLLIPFFIWPIVVKQYIINHNFTWSIYELSTEAFHQLSQPSIWFLLSLFKIMIVFSFFVVIAKILRTQNKLGIDFLVLSFLSLIVFISNPYEYNNIIFLIHTIFFFIGVFLSKHALVYKIFNNKLIFLSSAILFLLLINFYQSTAPATNLLKGLKILLIGILSLCATITLYNFAKVLELPKWLDNFLQVMGSATLVIYVTPINIIPDSFVFSANYPLLLIAMGATLIAVVHMYISLGIGKIVACLPVLNLLLYGKRINIDNVKVKMLKYVPVMRKYS